MSLSLPKAELIGVFLESLLYGVYFLIFIQCMRVLRRRQSRPGGYLLGTAVSLFVLVTAHLVIDITRNMDAFTSNMGTPNYAVTYYDTFDTWKNIVKSALGIAQLYRTFVVWGRNYLLVILPFLLLLADIAIGIFWVYTLSLVTIGDNVYTDELSVRVKVFYSITLAMNVMCTCLIAFKVWKIQKAVAPFVKGNQGELSRLIAIVVESGSAYSAVLVAMIITYANNSPIMFIFLNSMSPIIGIVFSSVITRVGSGLSHGDSYHTRSHTTDSRAQWAIRASGRQSIPERLTPLGSFPGGSVQIALSHTVHTHVDGFQAEDIDTDADMGSADVMVKSDSGFLVV